MGAQTSTAQIPSHAASGNRVQLAFTPLDVPFVPTAALLPTAYHTSVIIGDKEFSFSSSGINSGRLTQSHHGLRNKSKTEKVDLGVTFKSGGDLCRALSPFFREGSYDLLRKNCNSFSACAMCFLLGARLEEKFQALERFASDKANLVQLFTLGDYTPNVMAEQFNQAEVCEFLSFGRPSSPQRGAPPAFRSQRSFERQRVVFVQ